MPDNGWDFNTKQESSGDTLLTKTRQEVLRLVRWVLIPMAIGGTGFFFYKPDAASGVWAIIGPIISSALTSCIILGRPRGAE